MSKVLDKENEYPDDIGTPPRPVDDPRPSSGRLIAGVAAVLIVLALAGFMIFGRSEDVSVKTVADLERVYDHAQIITTGSGDTLESATLALFPQRVYDELSPTAPVADLARTRLNDAWVGMTRRLNATTGTDAGVRCLAVPASADMPGAIPADEVNSALSACAKSLAKGG